MKRILWPTALLAGLGLLLAACNSPKPVAGDGVATNPVVGATRPGSAPNANVPVGDSRAPANDPASASTPPANSTSPAAPPAGGGNTPAQPATGPGQSAPGDTVTLAYAFHRGEKSRYRTELDQEVDMNAGPGGGSGGAPGSMRMRQTATMDFLHTVRTVERNGSARVAAKIGDVQMSMDMGPMKMDLSVKNGRISGTANGQPLPQNSPQAREMLRNMLQQTAELRLARNGKLLSSPGSRAGGSKSGQNPFGSGGMIGSGTGGYGSIVLPGRPIRADDSWKDSQTVDLPAAMPGGGSASNVRISLSTTYRLKEIVVRNGRRVAVIESDQVGKLKGPVTIGGPMKMQLVSMTMQTRGTTEFDVEGGYVTNGEYSVVLKQAMRAAAPGRRPPGGGPGSGTAASGTLNLSVSGSMKLSRL